MPAAGNGPAPAPEPRRDPGLQPERTRLAWRRSTLSCTIVALLAARQAVHHGATAAGAVAAALSALVWVCFLLLAHRRSLALESAGPRVLSVREATLAAACTVVLAAFAVAVVV